MNISVSRKGAYIGAGAGVVLFALFGLLPGSLLGGAAGIKAAGMLFGLPLQPGIIAKGIILLSMLVGVAASGIMIIAASSTTGWLVARAFDAATQEQAEQAAVLVRNKE